jgi:P27 family predicted phage terminase small subunit
MPRTLESFAFSKEKDENAASVRVCMRSLNTYKREYEPIIQTYAGLMAHYATLVERFETEGYQVEVFTAAAPKKSPLIQSLETLRRDLLQYAGQLGLTPASLKKMATSAITPQEKESPLAAALRNWDG